MNFQLFPLVRNYLLFLVTLICQQVWGQQNKVNDYTWTLTECIDYAKQHNLQVANTQLTEQSAEQNLLLAKAARYPNLAASTSQTLTHYNPNIFVTAANGAFNSGYFLNSAFTLYNGHSLIICPVYILPALHK